MKKVLFVSNILSHIHAFHIPYLQWFREHGYEVHVMTNAGGQTTDCCDKLYDLPLSRSPFSFGTFKICAQAKKIMDTEQYDIVHCHTPMGGVLGRLASRGIRKKGAKVLYTAHGFHFYRGAPWINWLLYYNVEKALAKMTDCIITINEEDYQCAKRGFQSLRTEVKKISGIGVSLQRFVPSDNKGELKQRAGYGDRFLLFYAAEFIARKNHRFLVDAAVRLSSEHPNVKFLFAGKGELMDVVKKYAEKRGVLEYIDFLGFRTDVPELLQMSDVLVSASIEEGFGINVVEGMASGLPVIVSEVRGHKEMVRDGQNGYIFDPFDPDSFCGCACKLMEDQDLYGAMSQAAIATASEFSLEKSISQMEAIYKKYMEM